VPIFIKKKKIVLKKIFKTDVSGEIVMADNTQLILQSIVSQELLRERLLSLTTKTFYLEACYKEGEKRP